MHFEMASKFRRCIWLSLMLLLCWCVLRSDPVSQESDSNNESLSSEKVNHWFTEQEATPPLVSIHHTESTTPDILDQSSFVTRPAIAPATPWEDAQILSTIAAQSQTTGSSIEHDLIAEELSPEVNGQSSSELLEETSSSNDKEQERIEGDDSGTPAEADNIKRLIKSLDPVENDNKNESPLSEYGVQDFKTDDAEEAKNDQNTMKKLDGNKNQEGMENEAVEQHKYGIPDNEETLQTNGESRIVGGEPHPPPTATFGDNLGMHGTQEGTQDGLDGTQEDIDSAQDGLGGTQEDMPSFNEWSQKFLAQEEEKKVAQINEKGTVDPRVEKKKKIDRKQNNFASVDCGANIPEMNPEAQNAHSILLENKDLYMLNPCSANIWFIVELCDHVQITSLQLANFEMFSSTIKEFQVSFSTRYPTREWSPVQAFVAKPEKSIQTFTIDPIFAKYIKVEQLSHHGSEHYCPWSLLRVYGSSMVEEYEEHESSQDESPGIPDDTNTSSNSTEDKQAPQGILKSATDAVLNFVKETAKKLVNTEEEKQTNSTANITNNTKYSEDNSATPLPPKTIVQLIPREDYEASCHGDAEENLDTCFPGNGCGFSEHIPHSSQAFLEIVHNICGRNLKNAKACFRNLSRNLPTNTSSKEGTLRKNTKKKGVDMAKRKMGIQLLEDSDRQFTPDEDPSKFDDLAMIVDEQKTDDVASSVQNVLSEASSETSTPIHNVQTSADSAVASTVITEPDFDGSFIKPSSISSSVSSIVDESLSAPTPLVQPPLAVNDEPDIEESPTNQPDLEETISQRNTDTVNLTPSEENVDSSEAADQTVPQVTSTSTSSITSSIETDSAIEGSEKISTQPQFGGAEVVNRDTSVHEGSPVDNREPDPDFERSHRGNKEHEDVPNPHVDVLKITLTDEETKEGTAEPEQPNGDEASETRLDATMVNSVEERDLGKLLTDGGGTEKGTDEAETIEDKPEKTQIDESTEIDRNDNVLTENYGQRDSNDDNPDTDLVKQDSTVPREGQCEMKDSAESSKMSEEGGGSSNIDPGPTLNAETIPTHATVIGSTYGKKESIFVTLSRKIKALEQNVTMTNLFLEELSQRYRKSMDDMQKKMEKKFSLLSKNSKHLTKVNLCQNSTIIALTSKMERLEEKLNEATARLNTVNQEVVERHVIGICLQLVFALVLWLIFRRTGRKTEHAAARQTHLGNGHVKNGSVVCNGMDYYQQNETAEEMERERNYFEEYHASKPLTPEALSESKRRKRRKNRPNSVASDRILHDGPSEGQNIVSRTAGLLFHSPGSHDNIRVSTKDSGTSRSCSADSLSIFAEDERKLNAKKCASSPKARKVLFQGKQDAVDGKTRNGTSEARIARERHNTPHTKLVRSKSSGECYENKLVLSDISLSSDTQRSLENSRCSLQSTSDSLKNQKGSWIWGFG